MTDNNPTEILYCEFGCSIPIRFITKDGMKTMKPGKRYDDDLEEITDV